MIDSKEQDEQRERYRELLDELRTVIPGVQVLLAFLLTVPFAARFSQVDRLGKVVFSVSLMSVAAATVLLLAPAAYHRLADRRDRRGRLQFGIKTALAGLVLLAISICCAVFVVVRFLFDSFALAIALATATAVLAVTVWFLLPVLRRSKSGGSSESERRL